MVTSLNMPVLCREKQKHKGMEMKQGGELGRLKEVKRFEWINSFSQRCINLHCLSSLLVLFSQLGVLHLHVLSLLNMCVCVSVFVKGDRRNVVLCVEMKKQSIGEGKKTTEERTNDQSPPPRPRRCFFFLFLFPPLSSCMLYELSETTPAIPKKKGWREGCWSG